MNTATPPTRTQVWSVGKRLSASTARVRTLSAVASIRIGGRSPDTVHLGWEVSRPLLEALAAAGGVAREVEGNDDGARRREAGGRGSVEAAAADVRAWGRRDSAGMTAVLRGAEH